MAARSSGKQSLSQDNAIELTTYAELEQFAKSFAAGYFNLLIIIGERGLQKSTTVRRELPDTACWIQGAASPFVIYQQLYKNLDCPVVIDDVDRLYRNKDGINLLKCLCQTEARKTVSWQSANRELEKQGIPREFVTTSQAIIISNDWQTLNENVAAVEDRGHVLRFVPTAKEVHERTGAWFDDAEIYGWVEERLHLIRNPSMRLYYRARELKNAGFDWRRLTPLAPEDHRRRLVADLLNDQQYETQEERVLEFRKRGGGCRSTFYNHARRLRAHN